MTFTTKFDLGQTVFGILTNTTANIAQCPVCRGAKNMVFGGHPYQCTTCDTYGEVALANTTTRTVVELTIGSVKVLSVVRGEGIEYEEEYMCVETGVGSGRVWDAQSLFATRAEAEAELARLEASCT